MKMIDIHQHILPGVDDGARNSEHALAMLRLCEVEGIDTVIATPHFDRCRYRSEKTDLHALTEQLNQACTAAGIGVQVVLGSEIFSEPGIYSRLRDDRIPTMAGSRYVLVEYAYEESFSEIRKNIQKLSQEGFTVIMAHVERYQCIYKDPSLLEELKEDFRVLAQVNAADLMGEAGFWIKRYCRKLLKKDMIDFIATDGHNTSSRAPKLKECMQYVIAEKGQDYAEKIFRHNPEKILNNIRF